jgi:hypothetical protein
MKQYPRTYELVFSDQKRIDKKCALGSIGTYNNIPNSNIEYIKLLRNTIKKFQDDFFDALVKYAWLTRRFCYKDERRKNKSRNGVVMDFAFGIFMRRYVGYDNKGIMISRHSGRIISYFDDFFTNFDEGNPFEEIYEYPYKYISLDYLLLVYQMPERLELLQYAEDNEMSYTKFLDYILNYVSCYNEEHGEIYVFMLTSKTIGFPYVRVNQNYESTKTSSVRSRKRKIL